jgi:hypothetical protein
MEYSVELLSLPDGVAFPGRLEDRVRFDPTRRRLIFQGFMTKCAYDELATLTDDAAYHRALEQLFVATSAAVSAGPPQRRVPAAILTAALGTAVVVGSLLWAATRFAPSIDGTGPRPEIRISAVAR